jgi:oxygen-dependent protoporphyrinogen oxidase
MSTLTNALEERVKPILRLHTRVETIRHKGPFRWEITTADGATEETDFVCLTLPAPASGKLLKESTPELAGLLSGIDYASSATVSLAYRREQIRHPLNAMGFVIPATEKRTLNSCSFSSEKFEGRAPEGYVLLRGFTGGKMDAHVYAMPDDELIAGVERDLADLLGIEGKPIFTRLSRWEKSMAQYAVGHVGRVMRIEEEAAKHLGLSLGGNGFTGVGVPDVIARSERIATDVISLASQFEAPRACDACRARP